MLSVLAKYISHRPRAWTNKSIPVIRINRGVGLSVRKSSKMAKTPRAMVPALTKTAIAAISSNVLEENLPVANRTCKMLNPTATVTTMLRAMARSAGTKNVPNKTTGEEIQQKFHGEIAPYEYELDAPHRAHTTSQSSAVNPTALVM